MNRTRIRGLLALVPTLLCTSCVSLPGAWYYQAEDAATNRAPGVTPSGNKNNTAMDGPAKDAEGDKGAHAAADPCDSGLYFAVLNDRHKRVVTKVEINGGEASGTGWTCVGGSRTIKGGQLLVLKLPLTQQANCAVPVDARLWVTDSSMPVRIDVSAAMPSALPIAWLKCPLAPSAACTNSSKKQSLDCAQSTEHDP